MKLRLYRIDLNYKMGDNPEAEAVDPVVQFPYETSNMMVCKKKDDVDLPRQAFLAFSEFVILSPGEVAAAYLDAIPAFYYDGNVVSTLGILGDWPTLPLTPLGT